MSQDPELIPVITLSFFGVNLDNSEILIGKPLNLSLNVSKCCLASKVVGVNKETCFPLIAAKNEALRATSVFPKPTSPQINLSIGSPFSRSF